MTSIFVADDEAPLRDLLEEALTTNGYTVETFADGESLLAAVPEGAPDAILLDINMPGMSGWDVQRRLAEDPSTESIPVIAVTARGGPSVETSAQEGLGFTGFVRKPFRLDELVQTLADALNGTGGEAA